MTEDRKRGSAEALDKLTHKWWETTVLDATGEYVWDEEVKAVNAMMAEVAEFPEWALQIRDAMPKYGFEMCSYRWLDGLDDVIRMIGAEKFRPSDARRYGDVPGRIVDAAGQRACSATLERWGYSIRARFGGGGTGSSGGRPPSARDQQATDGFGLEVPEVGPASE